MSENKPKETGALLLEIGALLMSAGANTNRIRLTMQRIANSYDYEADFLITHRAIILTLKNATGELIYNHLKQTYAQFPNFKMVSGISLLSWQIADGKLSLKDAKKELNHLKKLKRYPRLIILAVVALACSSFCRLSDGSFTDMLIVFIAAFAGLFFKQELTKKHVNPYFTVFIAAFLTTLISVGITKLVPFEFSSVIFVTSVLYLIPGIPLINSISDILDGNSLNGLIRAINGTIISFAIASGLLVAVLIYNVL